MSPTPAYWVVAGFTLFVFLTGLAASLRSVLLGSNRNARRLILLAMLFFGLGMGLALLPAFDQWRGTVFLALIGDLAVLGFVVAWLDAFEEGETLLPDMIRSFFMASLTATVFAAQVGLAIVLGSGWTFSMAALLLTVIATALLLQAFVDPVQAVVDAVSLPRSPEKVHERVLLRGIATATGRAASALPGSSLEPARFTELTRRALSNMGTLPRLATSPLNHLLLVDVSLQERDISADTLARAGTLRAILQASIAKLRPLGSEHFGTTDEWRHFNALYFPYVAGLKPYSRRALHGELDEDSKQALSWFRRQVPERTLYNWQRAAAALVAQDLLEQEQRLRQAPLSDK